MDQNLRSSVHTSNMSSMLSSTAHQAVPSPRIKTTTPNGMQPGLPVQKDVPLVLSVLLSTVEASATSAQRPRIQPSMRDAVEERPGGSQMASLLNATPTTLDPSENMGIKEEIFKVIVKVRDRWKCQT